MTQQTTTDEFKDVAADATNNATEFGKQTAERVVGSFKEAGAKAASLAADTQKTLGAEVEDFSKRLQGVSSFNQQTLEAFARSSEVATKAFENRSRACHLHQDLLRGACHRRPGSRHGENAGGAVREADLLRPACLRGLGAADVQDERNLHRCRQGHRSADRPTVFGGRRRGKGLSLLDWYLA